MRKNVNLIKLNVIKPNYWYKKWKLYQGVHQIIIWTKFPEKNNF